jgi:tRNA threonylcarbamoyladenosine biosynthesis protein TsaB
MSNLADRQSLILTADTSSVQASLALSAGRELLGLLGLTAERRSAHLLSDIDWLLTRLARRIDEIEAFAIITGPGSFTGLRVGMATLKGLAQALSRPIVAVTALEAIAYACGTTKCTCVLIDAGRGDLFAQLFALDAAGNLTALSESVVSPLDSVLKAVAEFQAQQQLEHVVFAGAGASLHSSAIGDGASLYAQPFYRAKFLTSYLQGWVIAPYLPFLAQAAALYAQEKYLRGEIVDVAEVNAYYVRPAEAEIKFKLGLIGKKKGDLAQSSTL